jgi:hypothetical protein
VFWLTYRTPKGICVVLQPAGSLIHAKLAVDMQNLTPGKFTEGRRYPRARPRLAGKLVRACHRLS